MSPTYAQEILTPAFGFGLDGHLRAHADRLRGILNGIDQARFDPATDEAIAVRFGRGDVGGKLACRSALAAEMGLSLGAGPLFGVVSRLTWQKGIDLLLPIFDDILEKDGRVVVVGQGDRDLEHALMEVADRSHGRIAVRIAFDPPLSRRIYAGSDFFVVPSRFEPCGLTQMYAMRYGALPIVTDVGGLHDTVQPGRGILAKHPDVGSLRAACAEALTTWADHGAMARAVERAMSEDFSWAGPARSYIALYEELIRSS